MAAPRDGLFEARWGTGGGVLAIHGLGASALYWDPLGQALRHVGVNAVDLLGFGRSPNPVDAAYDLDCHVDAVEPHLSPGMVVVAHSTGCIVALGLALRRPDAVAALVLTGLPAWPDRATAIEEVARQGAMARWTAQEHPLGERICRFVCQHRRLAAALAPLLVRSVPAAVAVDGTRHSWRSYSRTLLDLVVASETPPLLAAVDVPVTVVHGSADATTRPEWVRRLPAREGRTIVFLDGVDHHPALRAVDRVAAAVTGSARLGPG